MRHRLFVTGTDTNVGKTHIAAALLMIAKQRGLSTAALKPVAAGCEEYVLESGDSEWRNADAILLQQLSTISLAYQEVNPVALKQAIAPHLAAYTENKTITIERLSGFSQNVFSKKADLTVIEGAGGWRVPLSHRELYSQYVQKLQLPTLLVVGVRLGCINHTLLTVESIMRDNIPFIGWVANCVDQHMDYVTENVQTLERLLPAPCLGIIPFQKSPDPGESCKTINFDLLLKNLSSVKIS